MFESMYNLLPFFYYFQGLPLEFGCLATICDIVITYPLNGFISGYSRIIKFGIKLKVSNISYHGCYGNTLSLVLVSS
jgi:hypothetical protein